MPQVYSNLQKMEVHEITEKSGNEEEQHLKNEKKQPKKKDRFQTEKDKVQGSI